MRGRESKICGSITWNFCTNQVDWSFCANWYIFNCWNVISKLSDMIVPPKWRIDLSFCSYCTNISWSRLKHSYSTDVFNMLKWYFKIRWRDRWKILARFCSYSSKMCEGRKKYLYFTSWYLYHVKSPLRNKIYKFSLFRCLKSSRNLGFLEIVW